MARSKLQPRRLIFSLVKAREGRSHYWTTHFEGALSQHGKLQGAANDLVKVLLALRDGHFEVRMPNLDGNLEKTHTLDPGWLSVPALLNIVKGKRPTKRRKLNEIPQAEEKAVEQGA
jgi:hypothetical protein